MSVHFSTCSGSFTQVLGVGFFFLSPNQLCESSERNSKALTPTREKPPNAWKIIHYHHVLGKGHFSRYASYLFCNLSLVLNANKVIHCHLSSASMFQQRRSTLRIYRTPWSPPCFSCLSVVSPRCCCLLWMVVLGYVKDWCYYWPS